MYRVSRTIGNHRVVLFVGLGTFLCFWGSLQAAHAASAVESLQEALIKVAEQLKPSVVNISSEQVIKQRRGQGDPEDFFKNFPFGEQFPFTPPRPPGPGGRDKETSLGTGIVVREDGYILTNNHVVRDATTVKVVFDDGSDQPESVAAKVIGTDPEADIAVLKIAKQGLKAVEFGDSEALKVGSLVIAIGSPYRFEHTVTFGVVSAKGRHLVDESRSLSLQDYIQTDASINRGNSGGPLVDINGKVVGINSAIWTPTGGNIGIGFAVPINTVKSILPKLIKGEKIERGWLGIQFRPLSKDTAEFLGVPQGFEVSEVLQGSPSEKAGIQKGDIIVEFDGKKLTSSEQLRSAVAALQPGKTIKVKVLRTENDKVQEKEISIALGTRPGGGAEPANPEMASLLGLSVQEATPENLRRFGHPDNTKGVLVTEVEPGSAADDAEITPGDLVIALARDKNRIQTVRTVKDYNQMVENLKEGDRIFIRLQNAEGLIRTQLLVARKAEKKP